MVRRSLRVEFFRSLLDNVVGFQHVAEADCFLAEYRERLRKFGQLLCEKEHRKAASFHDRRGRYPMFRSTVKRKIVNTNVYNSDDPGWIRVFTAGRKQGCALYLSCRMPHYWFK